MRYQVSMLLFSCMLMLATAMPAIAQTSQPATTTRFTHFDLFIDPQGTALAAYQVQIDISDPTRAQLVGVEGGEHAAFKDAPFYDPKALAGSQIKLAAFSLDAQLPTGPTRIARVHLRITDDAKPELATRDLLVVDANRSPIRATITLKEGARP